MRDSRRNFLRLGAAAALAGSGVLPARGAADASRLALVVGNNGYPFAPLRNAINDAKAVGALLERSGFAVTLATDTTRAALREAAATFGAAARSREAKQVFFYYAGHGAQTEWRNYLLPVDARVGSADDLPGQCLDLGVLLKDLAQARDKVFVLILDACRDNPFGASFRPAQKGLSQFDAPAGSLLAFSTAPGSVAADGRGDNGLYTENLVRELSAKGVRLEDALKRVRLAVRLASKGAQVPWESTSLESDIFLFPTNIERSEAELEQDFERELVTWNRIKGSTQPEDWIGYLRDYPSGKFNEIAQNRLVHLLRADEERRRVAAAAEAAVAVTATPASGSPATSPDAATAGESSVLATSQGTQTHSARTAEPDLAIRPGLPVPVLMRPWPNPASAGTYPNLRTYTVGDRAVYAVSDPIFGGKRPGVAIRVTRVDADTDRVEVNDGRSIFDTMGNLIKTGDLLYDPRQQVVPAELQVGRKWTTRFRVSEGMRVYESFLDYQVVGREWVKVPAGDFEAFKVEGSGFNRTLGTRLTVRTWIVPGFNFPLRSETIRQPRNSVVREGELRELVACRQMRWTVA